MNNVIGTTIWLMGVTLVGKILGLGRELVLAATYGTSYYSDIYLISLNIPIVIFSAVGAALGTVYMPLYFKIKNELGEKKSIEFTNNMFNIVIIVCTILAVLGFIFTKPLLNLFAIGFKGDILNIAIEFTRILIFGIISMGISNILTSYLQANDDFITPGMISIPYNAIIIVFMIVSTKFGPKIMVIGTLIAIFSQSMFQIPYAYKKKFKYKTFLKLDDKYIKRAVLLIAPVFVGIAVNQINAIVDKSLASTLIEGSISALNYANKLNTFIMALFTTTIVSIMYPRFSKLSNEKNRNEFINSIYQSINSISLIVIPISVGAIVLANPIVEILFKRGQFDYEAVEMTVIALRMYSIGMIGYALRDILGKVFYSIQDTKTPMLNGVISMFMNIFLNIILIKYLKHGGLALATSISSIVCIILLFKSLQKKMGYFGQDKIFKTILKSLVSSIFMGLVSYYVYLLLINLLGTAFIAQFISLSISILLGGVVYLLLIYILKTEEISLFISIVKSKKGIA